MTRRTFACVAGSACLLGAAPHSSRMLKGVNLAGLEFNPWELPGRLDRDYVKPTVAEFDYYRGAGFKIIRLPFIWERAQPLLSGALDPDYTALLDESVAETKARGMSLILDAHQFGRRRSLDGAEHIIGEPGGPSARDFAHFWGAIAARYRNAAHVIFNLVNEPHDQDSAILVETQNSAIASIRAAGAKQLVLVSGNAWSGAHSWTASGNTKAMLGIEDAGNNFAFDVHQYLDGDASGAHATCRSGRAAGIANFAVWARAHRKRGFLGEFGAGANEACATELNDLLRSLDRDASIWLGWTYWAGGPWWGTDYILGIEPVPALPHVVRPQMVILQANLR